MNEVMGLKVKVIGYVAFSLSRHEGGWGSRRIVPLIFNTRSR